MVVEIASEYMYIKQKSKKAKTLSRLHIINLKKLIILNY